jgi:hypothetical protein
VYVQVLVSRGHSLSLFTSRTFTISGCPRRVGRLRFGSFVRLECGKVGESQPSMRILLQSYELKTHIDL